eukprot:gnl/TRDRNA2_/TRDRNA2_174188_c4_seq1.p2 gnl/TRDRNA2_/TRDRNA2_174188_c4~~gnl/TRDRNA2_/TRDRNA2_174188_c4_seq1.p2  ORF type:complete len:141 (+),score=14.58 gnl/TRDRNA2_/TRDRNA2_174188_c4_seq1:678-1100(+)
MIAHGVDRQTPLHRDMHGGGREPCHTCTATYVRPAALTNKFTKGITDLMQELLRIHRLYKQLSNHITISASWSSIGPRVKNGPAERRWLHENVAALQTLLQHTVREVVAEQTGARLVANVVHGAARVGTGTLTTSVCRTS